MTAKLIAAARAVMRVWAVEVSTKGAGEWRIWSVYDNPREARAVAERWNEGNDRTRRGREWRVTPYGPSDEAAERAAGVRR
jgi:hypothetical protein